MSTSRALICLLSVVFLMSLTGVRADDDAGSMTTGETRTYSQNGVKITVKKLPDEIKDYRTFEVTADNTNDAQKTLNGKICLANLQVKQPECGSGECTVYMEIPAKSTETKKWQCKEKSSSNSWKLIIVKIYDF